MEVRHLCFTAKDFLRLVGESEKGEVVYFQTNWGKLWKGFSFAGEYKVIREVTKHSEIIEIEERFYE
jgi:hypothetical protein